MSEIFYTVLLLSGVGTALVCLLLLMKRTLAGHLPVGWLKAAWVIATLFMVLPAWKAVPKKHAQQMWHKAGPVTEATVSERPAPVSEVPNVAASEAEAEKEKPIKSYIQKENMILWCGYIWAAGAVGFLVFALISYGVFCVKKQKSAMLISSCEALETVKQEMGIGRGIKVKVSPGTISPMLVGVFFPVIYLPEKTQNMESARMIFRHELMHYKKKDLFLKWFVLLVNAVHWFNPFAYILSKEVSQICEVSCDMAVVRGLSEEEKKIYMHTILSLVEQKGGKTDDANILHNENECRS